MKKILRYIILGLAVLNCSSQKEEQANQYYEIPNLNPSDTLFLSSLTPYELGAPFAYLNQKGDTMIPVNRFTHSFSDTIITYGIVIEKNGDQYDLIGINQKGQRLYEVYWFDNGPDYISDSLFRIKRNGKIGFANTKGQIVIQPEFQCAYLFENGRAKVTYDCKLVSDGTDYHMMKSSTWFFINKEGERVRERSSSNE